jgi:hypothetical protein
MIAEARRNVTLRRLFGYTPHTARKGAWRGNMQAVAMQATPEDVRAFIQTLRPGKQVQVPGCSIYEYDLASRTITGGRIYFDFATLLRQLDPRA